MTRQMGGRAGLSSLTSSFSPPHRCVVPTPPLAVAASLTSHRTLSPPCHCVAPHRHHITVTTTAIATAAIATAATLAWPPPPLLPSHRRHRRFCPRVTTTVAVALTPPPPLPPLPCTAATTTVALHRHLSHCHPCIATSAAVTLALPPPPPSPSRWRHHLAIHTSPTPPLAGDATPIISLFAWVACLLVPTHLSCLSHATMGMCRQMSRWACGGRADSKGGQMGG